MRVSVVYVRKMWVRVCERGVVMKVGVRLSTIPLKFVFMLMMLVVTMSVFMR